MKLRRSLPSPSAAAEGSDEAGGGIHPLALDGESGGEEEDNDDEKEAAAAAGQQENV